MKKKERIYPIVMALSLLALVGIFISLCIRTYFNSKENILNSNVVSIAKETKDFDYFLQNCLTEFNMSADMVDLMIKDGAPDSEIDDFIIRETEKTTKVFASENTGIYAFINGRYIDGAGWVPDADYVPQARPWYISAKEAKGDTCISGPYIDAQTSKVVITFSRLLSDNSSVVAFDAHLDMMQQYAIKISEKNNMHIIVCTKNGDIVCSSNEKEVGVNLNIPSFDKLHNAYNAFKNSRKQYFEFSDNSTEYIGFANNIYEGWYAIAIREEKGLYDTIDKIYILPLIVLVSLIVCASLFVLYLSRRERKASDISNQLQSLSDIYTCVYKLDYVHNTCEKIRTSDYIDNISLEDGVTPVEFVRNILLELANNITTEEITEFANIPNILKKSIDMNTYSIEFNSLNGWFRSRYVVISRKNGNIDDMLWVLENIDIEKKREEHLVAEVHNDELTGLLNRKAYEEKLKELRIEIPVNFAYIAMDVNELKEINDTFGHAKGDELLKIVSDCMKKSFIEYGTVYRVGGDEFVAFIDTTNCSIQKMVANFNRYIKTASNTFDHEISVAIGYILGSDNPDELLINLLKKADDFMYENKRNHYKKKGIPDRTGKS